VNMMISDPRNITTGLPIPSEGYADQPYVVQTDDGAWLLVVTTGKGHEGEGGQHMISMRSIDQGRTWMNIIDVEPADGPEASYAVLLKVPYGRIYCFYDHNTDNVREVRMQDGSICTRVDSLGHYVFKYSDDHGRSWSAQRYDVPVRMFACDRENSYGGALKFFWNVGRPLLLTNEVLLVLHKLGSMDFSHSEGCFMRSSNILTERDPDKITFETLPDGDVGLCAPDGGGEVAEEQSIVTLSDGYLCCIYRTQDGHPAVSYSRDGGHNWKSPEYLTCFPGGRRVKHPRAANFIWRCENGKFLYWFHNHGGPSIKSDSFWDCWSDRNPAWLMAAREIETPNGPMLEFTQPEILLYDNDPYVIMSYPDLIETDGRFWVTETQKALGRVHEIPTILMDGLFSQWEANQVAREGLLLELVDNKATVTAMPRLPDFNKRDSSRLDMSGMDLRSGFTIEVILTLGTLVPGQAMLDSRRKDGHGLCLRTTDKGTLALVLNDGRSENSWDTDPGLLQPGQKYHITFVVDGGPKIITVIANGVLCDGGDTRQFGWGRFSPHLKNITGSETLHISNQISLIRIYNRALRTSEAVANYKYEMEH